MVELPLRPLLPEWLTLVAWAALVVGLLALIMAALAVRRERRLAAHYAALMTGVDGSDVAAALETYVRRLAAAEGRIADLETQLRDVDTARVEAAERRIERLDTRLRRAVQRVELLRFAAFEDAGGDQSFAVAMLDDQGDGVVLSGLYGRSGTRVYAKPVAGGRSPYALSTEEQRVVDDASSKRADG